jgi:hypothetical protein
MARDAAHNSIFQTSDFIVLKKFPDQFACYASKVRRWIFEGQV